MKSSKFLLPLLLVPLWALAQTPAPAKPDAPAGAAPDKVPVAEVQRYVSVYRAIRDAYVEPLSDEQIMKAALRGLLADLDPHSAYLEKDDAEQLGEFTAGAYDGIGVELEQRPDRSLKIVAPIDDTPATKAGLRAGDVITAIDNKPIAGDNVDDASRALRGKPGSIVRLTIVRSGEAKPREVAVIRETIRVSSVNSRLLEPGFVYLRISAFQADTGQQVSKQLTSLRQQSGGQLKGVVLDLRSNPGGLLDAAVAAADAFLESGVIVSTRGRLPTANELFRATPGDVSGGAPLVVLVDGGTASAAEVLAGALRDQKRGLIMGSRTFGKGSVQSVVPLDNGDSLKLTTARYYTPNGKSIQSSGIRPDVVLHGETVRGLREQDLPGHLRGDDETDDSYAVGELVEGDTAIKEALARLKTAAGKATATAAAAAPIKH